MKAATLSAEVLEDLRHLAWDQWAQLGVSGTPPDRRDERAADPEALLLFTLEVARTDPRLFDEVLDWLALNEPLVSVHRLRNLCETDADRTLVAAALDWVAGTRGRGRRSAPAPTSDVDVVPLFTTVPSLGRDLDPVFSRHGLARPHLSPSGKSQAPDLTAPINFAFRLRRLLGLGVRAEIVRTLLTLLAPALLLTTRHPGLPAKVIAASAGFATRNVREGLAQLSEAGVVDVVTFGDERFYSLAVEAWARLLRLDGAPHVPLHHDWIPTFRALTAIARWLQQADLDGLTPYQRASRARTLIEHLRPDLSHAGIRVDLYAAHGVAFWDAFVAITRETVRRAGAPSGSEVAPVGSPE